MLNSKIKLLKKSAGTQKCYAQRKNPGRFAPDPVRPLDVSPQRRFAPGRFAPGRFAPLVVSPPVDSPQEENSTYFVEIYVNS